jgi:glucan phosphoethanolaminetransferase (alkaline phosphatase superfamily)
MTQGFTTYRKSALIALFSLFALLMLPNLIWWWYGHGIGVWIQALVVPVILLLVFFALLGDAPWLACLLLAPFALLAPMEAFFVATYRHPTSAEIIATLVATNPRETREYLGGALIPILLCLLAAVTLALLAARCSARARVRWRRHGRSWILVIAIATPLVAMATTLATTPGNLHQRMHGAVKLWSTLGAPVELGYPFGVFQRVAGYRTEWAAMRANASRLDAFRFRAHRISPVRQRQVYVLVIGESSRRANWQLFGYPRATNPELSRVTNLVPIGHMVTSWPESIDAIPQILTRKPITSKSATFDEASILRAMQEAGYETYWISNQLAIGEFDSPVSMYAYEAQHVIWLNHASWTASGSYDEDLLQSLRNALHDSNNDLFIVLHMMGSHLSYDYRYPARFKHFSPTYSDQDDSILPGIRMLNSYDNTILYTDHVLAEAINTLRHSDATTALWFESDHGEMLVTPTCSFAGHGLGTNFEFHIPAFFWYSDAYAQQFPGRVTNLRTHAEERTLSANTFESLIDMAGVNFPGHDETWSLFSPQWHYRPRIVNSAWQSDFDHAVLGKKCPIVIPANPQASPALPGKSSSAAAPRPTAIKQVGS